MEKFIFLSVIVLTVFSGFFNISFNTTSYAATILPIIFAIVFGLLLSRKLLKISNSFITISHLLIVTVCLLLIVSIILYGMDGLEKSLFSLIYLYIFMIITPVFAEKTHLIDDRFLKRSMIVFFVFLITCGYLSLYIKIENLPAKNVLIFREPSHYALVLIPIVYFLVNLIKNPVNGIFILLVSFILAFLIQNATLLVGCMFSLFLYILKHKIQKKMLLPVFAICLLVFLFALNVEGDYYDYFLSRLLLSTENISSLAYLSGWERAYLTFLDSYAIGAGFNRMGLVGLHGAYQDILDEFGVTNLNLTDGATLGSKIIYELGGLGILLLIVYMYFFLKILSKSRTTKNTQDLFFMSYFLAIFIEIFVRGVGYFTPNLVLYLSSIYGLFIKKTCCIHAEKLSSRELSK